MATLTPAEEAACRATLAALEKALDQLALGEKAVKVAYDGKQVEYVAADETRIRRRIRELRVKLGDARPASATTFRF